MPEMFCQFTKKQLVRKIMKIISLLVIKDPLINYKRQVSIGWQLHAMVLYFASSFLLCSHIGCISENKWMKCDGVGLNSLYCCYLNRFNTGKTKETFWATYLWFACKIALLNQPKCTQFWLVWLFSLVDK